MKKYAEDAAKKIFSGLRERIGIREILEEYDDKEILGMMESIIDEALKSRRPENTVTDITVSDVNKLHGDIMNIEAKPSSTYDFEQTLAYKVGHRDARHIAAELVLTELKK